jgi:uncharacterized membrane protein
MLLILKYIHILAMFGVTGLEVGPDILFWWVGRSRDVRAIRTVFPLARPIGLGITILAVIGLGAGLILVAASGYSYVAPWLIIAYILYTAGAVRNLVIINPWRARVLAATQKSDDARPSEDLLRVLRDPKAAHAVWINLLIDAGIIFDMVLKPFS